MSEAAAAKEAKDTAAWGQQERIVQSLKQLQEQITQLPSQQSAPQLSHYRTLPEAVQQSYDMLQQGAALVHATSTKYTLMGKLDAAEQTKICSDLLQGCQYLATGCLALHDLGTARSARHHARQAVRGILVTVAQLVECFAVDHATSTQPANQVGAQKTGAVWETCRVVTDRKLPVGNRNAMRRDLLTYKMECNETLTEFQEMIDSGPSLREDDDNDENKQEQDGDENDDQWEAFLDGNEDQYAEHEIAVATACVAIIKCSRGSINATLQAMECVGSQLTEGGGEALSTVDQARLTWMSALHDYASAVGNGMTDLGACLYPPLNLKSVRNEVERQAGAVEQCINHMVEATTTVDGDNLELSPEVKDLISKLQIAIQARRTEALDSIAVSSENNGGT